MRILFFLLVPVVAFADLEIIKFRISPVAFEQRFESTTDPVMSGRAPWHLSFGIVFDRSITTIEYSTFQQKTGNDTFNVDRKFQDLLAWYRYMLISKNNFRVVGGFGLGFYQEEIESHFYESTDFSTSGTKWAAATAVGIEYDFEPHLGISLDGRLMAGQNLDPNPQPSILTRFYFQF